MNLSAWQANVASLTRNLTDRHPHLQASLSVLHHPTAETVLRSEAALAIDAKVEAGDLTWAQGAERKGKLITAAACPPPCPSCANRHRRGPCPCQVCHTTHKGACPPYRPGELGRPGCLVCLNVDDAARANAVADLGDAIRSPSLEPGSRSVGQHSTPTETAAEKIDHGDAFALADAAMYRERVVDFLRLALHTPREGGKP